MPVEMSCPWMDNRTAKDKKKTTKCDALRWELKQQYPGYEGGRRRGIGENHN